MRKSLLLVALTFALAVAAFSTAQASPTSKSFQIAIIVATNNLDFSAPGPYYDMGKVTLNPTTEKSVIGNPAAGLLNTGTDSLTFEVAAQPSTPTSWAQVSTFGTALTKGQYRVSALFADVAKVLVAGDYTANDVLSTTNVVASADHLAIASDPITVKGYNVNDTTYRQLYFKLDLPSIANLPDGFVPGGMLINVTVTIIPGV